MTGSKEFGTQTANHYASHIADVSFHNNFKNLFNATRKNEVNDQGKQRK